MRPSYNTQFTIDAKQTVIVSVDVTQDGNDSQQLQPAVERLKKEAGKVPEQVLADSDYISRENVLAMAGQGVDLIGPAKDTQRTAQKQAFYQRCGISPEFYAEAFAWDAEANQFRCPQGKPLRHWDKRIESGVTTHRYQAQPADCAVCPHKVQCCPKGRARNVNRMQESSTMLEFRATMETEAARQTYRKRAQVAEFPNACVKTRYGLRQFLLRGLAKVRVEALWAALTFNIQQWTRLCWAPRLQPTT